MCFKKWFKDDPPPTWEHNNKVALLFGIITYPGGGNNNLSYCLNDINLAANKLVGFQIRKFENEQVTKKNFIDQVRYALINSIKGDIIYIHYSGHGTYLPDRNGDETDGYDEALYLYDGPLIDDDTNNLLRETPEGVIVILSLDSCFSGTATRGLARGRFMYPDIVKVPHLQVKRKFYDYMSWIVISACTENETAAEAEIDGVGYGAFSYFAFLTLSEDITYREWHAKIRKFLPSREFNQSPILEGPDELLDKLVFSVDINVNLN
jgi:hypothetical protein